MVCHSPCLLVWENPPWWWYEFKGPPLPDNFTEKDSKWLVSKDVAVASAQEMCQIANCHDWRPAIPHGGWRDRRRPKGEWKVEEYKMKRSSQNCQRWLWYQDLENSDMEADNGVSHSQAPGRTHVNALLTD